MGAENPVLADNATSVVLGAQKQEGKGWGLKEWRRHPRPRRQMPEGRSFHKAGLLATPYSSSIVLVNVKGLCLVEVRTVDESQPVIDQVKNCFIHPFE